MLFQLLINGIVKGALIALAGLGFALYYNTTRIFHIAYAAIYTSAAYFFFSFYRLFDQHWLPAFLFTAIATMILGLVIEGLVYRPLSRRHSSLNIILVASIGLMIVIVNLIAMLYGNEVKVIVQGISPSVSFGDMIITIPQIYQLFISLFFIISALLFLKLTRWGKITRAIRDDDQLSMAMGVNIWKMRFSLMAASSLLVAVPSVLTASDVGMDPFVGMPILLSSVVAIIIGGIGRFEGPIIGGFILGILQALVVWQFSTRWVEAATFALLILFLLFRPHGFIGERRREV